MTASGRKWTPKGLAGSDHNLGNSLKDNRRQFFGREVKHLDDLYHEYRQLN
jgi:hypothetical protein